MKGLMKLWRREAAKNQQFRFAQRQDFLVKNVGTNRH